MKNFIGVFVVYIYLLTTTRADQYLCSESEVLDYCKNPCEPTCQEPQRTPCPTFACQSGCACGAGTVRDEISGECISPQYCPSVCPINEVPNDCRDNCEPTCQNQNEFQCVYQNKKCICQPGLLRDLTSGKCVAPDSCPKECGRNEQWNLCTKPACRKTCQSSFSEPYVCPQVCAPGCECVEGYVWDEYYNNCVPQKQCGNVCGINAEWKNCSDFNCRRTCQDPKPKSCPKICTPGCSCKEGFLWDEQVKQCVPAIQCSKYCDQNEEWRECSDIDCRETCQKSQPKICTMICISGCSCKDGYIWDEYYKKCVCRGHCSKVCDENAEWHESVPPHVPTCRNLTQPQSSQTFDPLNLLLKSGCICKKGFVWEEFSQKCVRPKDCPGITTTAEPTTTTVTTTPTAVPTTTTAVPTTTTAVPTTTTNAPTTTTAVPTTTTAVPTTTTAVPTTTTVVPTTTTAVPTTTTAVPTTTTAVPTTTTAVPTTTTAVPTTTTAVPTTTTAVPTTTTAVPTTTTAVPTTTTAVPTTTTAVPTTTTAVPTTTTAAPTTTNITTAAGA